MLTAFSRTKTDDIEEARLLLQELFFEGSVATRVHEAQAWLRRWTANRVDELFLGKAKRVDAFELLTLRAMKEAKLLREGQLLRDARRGHAEFIDETERLAEMFAPDPEDHNRDAVALRRTLARGMDLSRNEGRDE